MRCSLALILLGVLPGCRAAFDEPESARREPLDRTECQDVYFAPQVFLEDLLTSVPGSAVAKVAIPGGPRLLVVWRDGRSQELKLVPLLSSGRIPSEGSWIPTLRNVEAPMGVWRGDEWLVVWSQSNGLGPLRVVASHVDPTGEPRGPPALVGDAGLDDRHPRAVSQAGRVTGILWMEGPSSTYGVTRLFPDGGTDDVVAFASLQAPLTMIGQPPDRFLLVWAENGAEVLGRHLESDGGWAESAPVLLSAGFPGGGGYSPVLVQGREVDLLMVAGGGGTLVARIAHDGTLLDPSGIPVGTDLDFPLGAFAEGDGFTVVTYHGASRSLFQVSSGGAVTLSSVLDSSEPVLQPMRLLFPQVEPDIGSAEALSAPTVVGGTDAGLAVWEARSTESLHARVLESTGAPAGPLLDLGEGRHPALAFSRGTTLLAYQSRTDAGLGVTWERVSPDGGLGAARSWPAQSPQSRPVLAGHDAGFVLAWQQVSTDTGFDVVALRLDPEGVPIDAAPVPIASSPDDEVLPSVLVRDGKALLALERASPDGGSSVQLATLDLATGLVSGPARTVGQGRGDFQPNLASTSGLDLIAFVHEDSPGNGAPIVALVDSNGALEPPGGIPAGPDAGAWTPRLLANNGLGALTWNDQGYPAVRLSAAGGILTLAEIGSVFKIAPDLGTTFEPAGTTEGWFVTLEQGRFVMAGRTLFGQRELGTACSCAGDCASGICVDGMCCDSACTDSCFSCSVGGGAIRDGVCTPVSGKSCEDGNLCTVGDVCRSGVCQAGFACPPPGECRRAIPCEPSRGCDTEPLADGTPCSSGACRSGICVFVDEGARSGCSTTGAAASIPWIVLIVLAATARCRRPPRA